MSALILGGGISGLSAAWFLWKKDPQLKITLLEKSNRLGGWIQTRRTEGFLFEQGPRTFQTARCPKLLQLISEVGLDAERIFSGPPKRYLLHEGKLRSIASLLPRFLPALLREPFRPKADLEDESIYEFACRRLNPQIAELLFDPLTLGIYAGDIKKLSLRSCFPQFYRCEKEKGSLVKGMFASRSKGGGLFTLRGGMGRLIEELKKKLPIEVVTDCSVEAIHKEGVTAGGKTWKANQIFSALPGPVVGRLLHTDFRANSMWVVNLVYEGVTLPKKGFGYLIPTQEN